MLGMGIGMAKIKVKREWQGRERWASLTVEGRTIGSLSVRPHRERGRCYVSAIGGAGGVFAGSLAEALRLLRAQAAEVLAAIDETLGDDDEITGAPV